MFFSPIFQCLFILTRFIDYIEGMKCNYQKYFLISILCLISCKNDILSPEYSEFYYKDSFLKYRILYPKNFDKTKNYPLTLFLHGIGERGDDN